MGESTVSRGIIAVVLLSLLAGWRNKFVRMVVHFSDGVVSHVQ